MVADPEPPPHAGVRVPPPLIQTFWIALGGIGEWRWGSPSAPLTVAFTLAIVGVVLMGTGLGLIGAAAKRFKRAGTKLAPWKPTTTIVAEGPYRFSRNPIYLGFALIHAGTAAAGSSLWVAATLPLAMATIRWAVIAREERYLTAAFGETYLAYQRRVRRWL